MLIGASNVNMRKNSSRPSSASPVPEIDFSGGVRGKYAARYAAGTNVVVLAPDVASVFPDAESVNDALRALVQIARKSGKTAGTRKKKVGQTSS